jgi:hypothetical protein
MPTDSQPLNISLDLSKIKTTIPLIMDGTMARVRLKDVSQGDRDGHTVIKWEFILVEPTTTTEGGNVGPGFPLFVNFDLSQEWLQQKMAKFVDGLLGTGDEDNRKGKPIRPQFDSELVARMIGTEGIAKIIVTRSKKTDYVGNDIASLTYPQDLAV